MHREEIQPDLISLYRYDFFFYCVNGLCTDVHVVLVVVVVVVAETFRGGETPSFVRVCVVSETKMIIKSVCI